MITSIHSLICSDDAKATRAFASRVPALTAPRLRHVAPLDAGSILRDVLDWKYVAEEWDNDWLIFKSGSSETEVHPTHSEWEGKTYDHPRHHSIALITQSITVPRSISTA